GLIIPFFLMGTWQFINDSFSIWWQADIIGTWNLPHIPNKPEFSFWISLSILLCLSLWALVNIQKLKNKTTIREQKFINVLYWLLFFSFCAALGHGAILSDANAGAITLLALPLGILFSLNLHAISNNRLANLVHWLLLFAVLIVQYY